MTAEITTATIDVDEARRRTDEVRGHAESLWREMVELYEMGAHLALGYESWQDYAETEFGMNRQVAQQLLDAGRVNRAVLESAQPLAAQIPNEKVARVMAPLLPPAHAKSGRDGSNEQVAQAWQTVVKEAGEEPITASFAKRVLVKAGVLPDTSGVSGQGNWAENLGRVGDGLIKATKDMDRFEKMIGSKKPTKKVQANAGRYAEMAEALAQRLRNVESS
jgi:hypothetical protein